MKHLPYLLKLIDDDSELVKREVLKELSAYGAELDVMIDQLNPPVPAEEKQQVWQILQDYRRNLLRESWSGWLALDSTMQKLETGLTLLAEFQYGPAYPAALAPMLSQLALDFQTSSLEKNPEMLAQYLFRNRGLAGAVNDYENPLNSNLIYVLEKKRGLPISLACIYILVGDRLGLEIEGCNFPGHFLARFRKNNQTVFVDCFNGGLVLNEDALRVEALNPEAKRALFTKTTAEMILARVLTNLFHAYKKSGEQENSRLISELLKRLQSDQEEVRDA